MYELKCDVRGCGKREPIGGHISGFGPSPPIPVGWRVLSFSVELQRPRDPNEIMGRAFLKAAPPAFSEDIAEAFADLEERPPILEMKNAHICPAHEMPDVRAGDDA